MDRLTFSPRRQRLNRPVGRIVTVAWLIIALAAMDSPPSFDHDRLAIEGAAGRFEFQVEVASTPDQRAYGLMFRESLDDDRGMLFDFGRPQPVAMWMRNTFISLDILFISSDGRIVRIARDAQPLSEPDGTDPGSDLLLEPLPPERKAVRGCVSAEADGRSRRLGPRHQLAPPEADEEVVGPRRLRELVGSTARTAHRRPEHDRVRQVDHETFVVVVVEDDQLSVHRARSFGVRFRRRAELGIVDRALPRVGKDRVVTFVERRQLEPRGRRPEQRDVRCSSREGRVHVQPHGPRCVLRSRAHGRRV